MSETTILRTSAIVRAATFAPPQHGPVKTGALPLVQVRMAPGGPQIQNGQQKAVEILPPRDAQSALAIGGLPMVQVKMTSSGPQVHTLPTVQGGPPQIPAAAPALSAPRGVAPSRQVVAAPRQTVTLPPVPELPTDQLMLCRHLVEKYLGELRATDTPVADTSIGAGNAKLAELTILTLDEMLVATAVLAEAKAEMEALAETAAVTTTAVPTAAFAAAASIAPAPTASYVAGRVGMRPHPFAGARAQRNSAMAPRRVTRPDSPLPPVIVKMEGQRAVVLNRDVIDQSRTPAPSSEVPEMSGSEASEGAAQG